MSNVFRHGDVVLVAVDGIPDGGKPVKRENRKLVLARGEVTGHSHTIATPTIQMIEVNGERYLKAVRPFVIRHQEHTALTIPEGIYRVQIQREYSPAEIKRIVD